MDARSLVALSRSSRARTSRACGRFVALAVALLVIAVSVVGVPARGAQTATPVDHAHFDPAACPTPILPGYPQAVLGSAYSCGYLTVPVDHTHPDGPTLKIAVARVKAVSANPKPDPIVYLTGGPGGSGLLAARAVMVAFLDNPGPNSNTGCVASLKVPRFTTP